MNNSMKKYELSRNTANVQLGYRLSRGMTAFARSVTKLVIMLTSWLTALALWLVAYRRIDFSDPLIAPVKLSMYILLPLAVVAVSLALLWIWGGPIKAGTVQRNLIRAGLVNAAGEGPTLVDVSPDATNSKIKILKFVSVGIPFGDWQDKKEEIQAALNITVADIRQGSDNRHILIYAAPPVTSLPRTIHWPGDSFGSTVLALGESVMGTVTVDLAQTPHILVGGSTGSGKTYLVLSLIFQALQKEMEVFIMDMKGGIDFPLSWKHSLCHYADTREAILAMLRNLTCELEERVEEFQSTERWSGRKCHNLDTYNTLNPGKEFTRIIIVCDELAEVTDTAGVDKPTKEQITAIIGSLGTLARLGRAFGLHLIMATQRPDASTLPGQVKNNADVRICGRADLVLSQIVLDNGNAADLPKDIPGRFLCNLNNGTIFQGYVHPDLEEGLI